MNNRLSLISLELERVLVSVLSYYKERCWGLVLGIIGRSAAARSLATRRLAFKISVLYFDVEVNGKVSRSYGFPSAA
ncbi:hypothetical protein RchiOBHm_Chr1g0358021 [Rosa chinensis]|uniref:Uncharacterized protein n=1 Tax=Rosa chinensis TaxID=74649 RepID=A0A2P6SI06_ROSCH|nr:hypothetical protein RchiOBHm_Chr1g0358021 [Rosa chinensis]